MTIEKLLEALSLELKSAFMQVPDYGSIGFTIHLREGEPVRIEWSGSTLKKLKPKPERGV